jgi:CheY-like chemotaxis protein
MTNSGTILLVEDSLNDIELTRLALEEANFTNKLVVIHDGQETLDYLKRQGKFRNTAHRAPLLVLLDINIPKIDGINVLRAIKLDKALKDIPVVMLTSSREEKDRLRSEKLGSLSFLAKPVTLEKLVEVVKENRLGLAVVKK